MLSHRAHLRSGATTSPCLLQDVSTNGFFILTNEKYSVGQVLELTCELYSEQVLHCDIEVRHVSDTCIGTKITEISPAAAALLDRFLQERYSLQLISRSEPGAEAGKRTQSSVGEHGPDDDLDFTKQ